MIKLEVDCQPPSGFHTKLSIVSDVSACIDDVSPYESVLQEAFEFQMVYGGLPEVIQSETRDDRLRYLDQYIQSSLEKDIRSVTDIRHLLLYQNLLEVLGCSRNILIKYRGYLVVTNVYHEVYPIMHDALKRIIKSLKGYVRNNGMENWFLKELQVWLDYDVKRH